MSCQENKENNTHATLANAKDSLSYILGAINAKTIVGSGAKAFENLDKKQIINGFNSNLSTYSADECLATLKKLFGENFQDFNQKYVTEGSLCMGKMTGYAFYYDVLKIGGIDLINLNKVKEGFADGLYKKDTFLSEQLKGRIMKDFMVGLNEKNGTKMMAKAKQIKGAKLFDNGVIIETIKEGVGPNPGLTDDVKVHYILTSALGDTIQNSYKMPNKENKIEPVALKLNGGVIPGWSYAIPKMKVGGTYRLYLPWELAYGEQQGRESLCFVVEVIARGKSGSFTDVMENKSTDVNVNKPGAINKPGEKTIKKNEKKNNR
jgi:FKBP-type peptidyl-prolyl cis-trans isomerase